MVRAILLEQEELLTQLEKDSSKVATELQVEQSLIASTLHQYQENSMLTTVQEAARVLCVLASRPELFG